MLKISFCVFIVYLRIFFYFSKKATFHFSFSVELLLENSLFLYQRNYIVKVKVLVTQSCPTLCDPMDYISYQSSQDSPGKNTGVGCHAHHQEIFLTQGLNPGLLHCRQILYHLNHQGSPRNDFIAPLFLCLFLTTLFLTFNFKMK